MLARAADALAAWNRGDPEGIAVNVAEDVIWRDVALGMPLHGREALKAAAQAYMTGFPDLRIEETSSTLAPPRLVQELTITGTHRGEFLGVPPTGRWTRELRRRDHHVRRGRDDDRGRALLERARAAAPARRRAAARSRPRPRPTEPRPTIAIRPSRPAASAAARSLRAAQLGGATTRSRSPAAT